MSLQHLTPEEKAEWLKLNAQKREVAAMKTFNTKKQSRIMKLRHKENKLKAEIQERRDLDGLLDKQAMEAKAQELVVVGREIQKEEAVPDMDVNEFVESLAREGNFREAMGENIHDPRIARFLKLIGEPANRSMTWCAKECGLTNTDLAKIWRNSTLAKAFFRIVRRMPEVADKVAEDSLGMKKACTRCDGLKRISVPLEFRDFFDGHETAVCPQCDGAGVQVTIGSAPHTQLIWERVGWSKKASGVNVNVNMADHSVDATISEMDGIEGEAARSPILEHVND